MLQSAFARAATVPTLSLALFAAIILIAWHQAPSEAVPAPTMASIVQSAAAVGNVSALPDDDEDIVDYSIVYPHPTHHATSTATYRSRVVNIP
jgi:hypothetical protein